MIEVEVLKTKAAKSTEIPTLAIATDYKWSRFRSAPGGMPIACAAPRPET